MRRPHTVLGHCNILAVEQSAIRTQKKSETSFAHNSCNAHLRSVKKPLSVLSTCGACTHLHVHQYSQWAVPRNEIRRTCRQRRSQGQRKKPQRRRPRRQRRKPVSSLTDSGPSRLKDGRRRSAAIICARTDGQARQERPWRGRGNQAKGPATSRIALPNGFRAGAAHSGRSGADPSCGGAARRGRVCPRAPRAPAPRGARPFYGGYTRSAACCSTVRLRCHESQPPLSLFLPACSQGRQRL